MYAIETSGLTPSIQTMAFSYFAFFIAAGLTLYMTRKERG